MSLSSSSSSCADLNLISFGFVFPLLSKASYIFHRDVMCHFLWALILSLWQTLSLSLSLSFSLFLSFLLNKLTYSHHQRQSRWQNSSLFFSFFFERLFLHHVISLFLFSVNNIFSFFWFLISVIWISCHRTSCKIKWQFHFVLIIRVHVTSMKRNSTWWRNKKNFFNEKQIGILNFNRTNLFTQVFADDVNKIAARSCG